MSLGDDATVQARFTADFSDLQAGAQKAAAAVESTSAEMAAGFETAAASATAATASMDALVPSTAKLTEGFSGLKDVMATVGIGIGLAALVDGMEHLATAAEDFGLQNAKFAAELGISESNAASLGMALKVVGVSTEDYANMALRMEMRLRTNEAAFRAYGMAVRGAGGELLNGEELMNSAITAMEQYRAGTDQNEFALQVFGRRAADVYDIIRANSALQKEAAQILQEMGVQTDGAGGSAAKLEEALAREKMQWDAVELAVSAKLMPTVTGFVNWVSGSGEPVLEGLGALLKVIATVVISVGTAFLETARVVAGAMSEVVEVVTGAGHVVVDVFKGDFSGAIADAKTTASQMGSTFHQVVAGIESDAQKAGAAISDMWSSSNAAGGTNPFTPPSGDKSFTDFNNKAVEDAQRAAQRIVEINKQTDDAIIAGKRQLNQSEYDLGQESLAQFTAQEQALALQKYNADFTALQAELAKKKITYGEFVAQKALLDQNYANESARIAEQSAQKEQALDRQALQEFITDKQQELQSGMASYDEQYRAGAISADQRAALESTLTARIQKEIDDRIDFDLEGMDIDSKAYADLEAQKLKIDKDFAEKHDTITKQWVSEDTSAYTKMLGPFNSAMQQMLSGTKSFASIGYDLLDKMIMNVITGIEKMVISWIVGEKTKTAATVTGNAMRTASNVGAAQTSNLADVGAMKSGIFGHAGSAAAAVWDDTAQIPVVGPFLAPEAAAAAFVAVMAFGDDLPSFAVGTDYVPYDMKANIHQGEAIIPANINAQMRAGGAGSGDRAGNDVALHYHPTINSREQATLGQMLSTHGHEMHAWIRREFRNGALRG